MRLLVTATFPRRTSPEVRCGGGTELQWMRARNVTLERNGRQFTEGRGTPTGIAFGDTAVPGCQKWRSDARRSWMHSSTKDRLHEAARAARLRHPGAVGELLNQELLSWMVFGHQLGSDLSMRLAVELLTDGVNAAAQPERPRDGD
jgi:hypothetical protein